MPYYGGVESSMNSSPSFKWKKGDPIGCGAHARVYKGQNLDTGELIAVKEVLVPASSGSREQAQDSIKAVQAEVNILSKLSHRNIVQYLGTAREEYTLNIFLEYIPCGSLSSLLSEFGPFEESVIQKYTKQLLQGLEYLHKNNIIHRDIKGANILKDKDGSIKLTDFGASKELLELEKVTGAKSVKGTPHWMAPEVIRQTGHGLSADIWSVGCTVIEMATGKPPWGQQVEEVPGRTESHPPIPDHLSSEAKDFLLKCLEMDPNLRPSASELLEHPFIVGNHIYDVFFSFRGLDVRNTLAEQLFQSLQNEGFHVFLDSKRIKKGENIGSRLEEAIKDSRFLIPIFSPAYAWSVWCLRELSLMWRFKARRAKTEIIPLFYDVEPRHVRYPESERSPYAAAFSRHRSIGRHSQEEMDEWKKALYEVSSLSGWEISPDTNPVQTIPVIVKEMTAILAINSRQMSATQVASSIATVTSTFPPRVRISSLLSTLIRFTSTITNSLIVRHPFVVGDHREPNALVRPSALGDCDNDYEPDDESEYYSALSSDSDTYSAAATYRGKSDADTIVDIVETAYDVQRVQMKVPLVRASNESIHQNGDDGFQTQAIQVAMRQAPEPIHRRSLIVGDQREAHPPSAVGGCDSSYELAVNSNSSSESNRSTSSSRLVVIKFVIENEKTKRKAIKLVAGVEGVDSLAMDMKENKITITGDADPVYLTAKLRKLGSTQLLSVSPAYFPTVMYFYHDSDVFLS